MPHSALRSVRPLLASVAALLALSPGPAHATNYTWNNTTDSWSIPANWGGLAPTGTNPTDTLTFGGDVGLAPYTATNDIPAVPFLLNQFILQAADSIASGNDNFLTGNGVLLSGAGAGITENGVGNFTFDMPVQLGNSITVGGTGTGTVTLNAGISGAFDIVKNGPSTLRFGTPFVSPSIGPSANTWVGALIINGGTVRFNNNAQSGPTALRANPVTMTAGSQLLYSPKSSDQASSLRLGTLSGSGGFVQARGQVSGASNQDSEDMTIWALTNGTYAGTIQNTAVGTGSTSTTLTVRGTATQTLTGTLSLQKDVAIGAGATLVLGGTASLSAQTSGSITLQGGSFVLDNRTTNNSDRLRDGSSSSTGLESIGGGSFTLRGNAGGSSETLGRLQLGATNERSGAVTIAVQHNAGSTASTVLNFQSYERDQGGNAVPLDTVDFTATDGSGNVLPLGLAGNNPRILFSTTIGATFPVQLANGLLADTGSFDASTVGWATVNGTDFASYDLVNGNGIVAVTTTPAGSTPAGNTTGNGALNLQFTASTTFSNAGGYSANSIKIAPSGAGQSLNLSSTGNLNTGAFLLAGSTDFSITSTGGGGIADAPGGAVPGPRYFQVQQAVLTVSASLAAANAPVVKAGNGTLVLTNAGNIGVTQPLVINAGVVRAQPGSSLPSGELEFRGGVLEITGGGTFTRSIGFGPGNLTWSGITGPTDPNPGTNISQERGSGGFSAFGADVTVDLNTAGASNLTWEDLGFVDSGYALIFGSRTANARTTFVDNIGLTQPPSGTNPPAANYNAREIRVIDNPSSTADSARLSGSISGTLQNDLLKTGDGLLELTGTSSYLGATLIQGGTLAVNGSIATSFLTDVSSSAQLTGKGTTGPVKIENGGLLAPGDIAGHASILNTATLAFTGPSAGLSLEIGGVTAGGDSTTGYDELNVTGSVTLSGSTLQLASLGGFTANPGQLFFIVNNDGTDAISGTFAQGSTVNFGAQTLAISYTADFATNSLTGGNDIALALAPEPTSAAFLAVAALGLVARRRRL